MGPATHERLKEAGIATVQQLAALTMEQLCAIKGIGEKTAQKILEAAQQAMTQAADVPADAPASTPAQPPIDAAAPSQPSESTTADAGESSQAPEQIETPDTDPPQE